MSPSLSSSSFSLSSLSSFSTKLLPIQDGAEREARTISHVVSTEGARLVRSDSSLLSVDENDNDDNDDDESDDDDNNNDDADYGGHNDNENNDDNDNNNGDDDGDDNNDDNNNNNDDDGDDNDPDSRNDEGLPYMRISSNVPLKGICMKVHTTSEHEQIADRPKYSFSNNLPKVCSVR